MQAASPLLDQLREIAPPAPVSWMPQTPAWYVLFAVALCLLLWMCRTAFLRWRKNGYRRAALVELKRIEASMDVSELPALLKRTALQTFHREGVAGVSGEKWLELLDRSYSGKCFRRDPGRLIPVIAYAAEPAVKNIPKCEIRLLFKLCENWIRGHHADV